MSVTCGQVVERALRRIGVVAAGEPLSASDLAAGIDALQEMVDSFRGSLFGRLRDVLATDDLTAKVFDRVIGNDSGGITVTLPTTQDGEAIRDGAVIEVRDLYTTVSTNYRWSADTARWQPLTALTAATPLPLGANFVGSVVAMLAVRLASDFNEQIRPEVADDARKGSRAIARAGDSRDDWEWEI